MAFEDGEFSGSDSDSEPDDGFEDDMEALRRACILAKTKPGDLQPSTSTASANSDTAASETDDDEYEDDLELVRKIQSRFTISTDAAEPLTLKPLSWLPPVGLDAGYEDDFETLRAIRRRFAAYDNVSEEKSTGDYLHKPQQVGATSISSEMENVGEGFPDCVDTIITTQNSPSPSDDVIRTPPVRDSSFPKSAQAFIDAIKKNRASQKFLRSKLIQIEARIQENKKLKERIKILKDFQVTCRKRTGRALSQKKDARVQLITVPKAGANAKDKFFASGPPPNAHVSNYRTALKKYPLSLSREKWSKKEKENLAKGIRQQFQEMLLQKSVDLLSGPDGSPGDSNDFDSILASIRDLDITPQNIRLFLPKVNWEQLASMYVPGRSGAECESRWLNCEDPLINCDPWTRMEDKNLLHIVQQKGINNWIDIAVSLGTSRTPFQCLTRYQRSLNASIMKREWTEDEDEKLRVAVEACGESNWQLVSSNLEGRTGTQCSNRWMKTLNPARKRVGRWNLNEDKRLKVAVTLFGAQNWKKIAQYVPGRTQVQCRERWVNCLDPSLNLDVWTPEEDSRLKAAIEEHGYCWSKVAACVSPRTDNQCRRRWKVLLPHEVPLLQAAKKMQKAAMISNFVDRESERPALGPNDFVPLQIEGIPESESVSTHVREKKESRKRPKHNDIDRTSCHVPKTRSKKHVDKAHISSEETPRLTNGNEVENLGNQDATSRRKKRIKCRSKIKMSTNSKRDCLSHCPDNMLTRSNGEESAGNHAPPSNERTLQRRNSESGMMMEESVEAHGKDDPAKKKTNKTKTKKKRKEEKVCPRNEYSAISTVSGSRQSALNTLETRAGNVDAVEAFSGDDEMVNYSQNISLPIRCSTPDIAESGHTGVSVAGRQKCPRRSKKKDGSHHHCVVETKDGGDSTLAPFITHSGENLTSGLSSEKVTELRSNCGFQDISLCKKSSTHDFTSIDTKSWERRPITLANGSCIETEDGDDIGGGSNNVNGSQNVPLSKCSTNDSRGKGKSSSPGIGRESGSKWPRTDKSGAEYEVEDGMTLASFCNMLKKA